MQKLIAQIKEHPSFTELERWNFCREYLQALILKSIFGVAMGKSLAFQGGTCLRICHRLKRYSEDLDFSLVNPTPVYSFQKLHSTVLRDLGRLGFDSSGACSEDKIVQKTFIRVTGLPKQLGLSMPEGQKLSVKIEVDVRPPGHGRRETYFVSRFGELFPVLKYDLPTLFAGKVLAILCRPYDRGRDYYDLIWFLGQRIEGNLPYLAAGLKQAKRPKPKNWIDVLERLAGKVATVQPSSLLKDLRPFLEDPADEVWIRAYKETFKQLSSRPR